ncbi:MAG: hypothetical protein IJA44_04155 [Clostridia bacterium]|nr:hypothetical protein [Clostridia bacterium]
MLYNLRSDIIYYKSGSDFELEFNLCGCCRMRLLTDKPSNKKTFVHSLARAVSRSRVILIAGPLFGEDNTIDIVAQALGTTTEAVNNSAYNIASDDEIQIIKGGLPLVSEDGSFGGCIIESGPQTMILLTDNKTLRKSIMSNLIHPYIAELYASEMQGNAKPTTAPEQTVDALEEKVDFVEEEPVSEVLNEDELIEQEIILEENKIGEIGQESAKDEDFQEECPLLLEDDGVDGNYDDIKLEDIFVETVEDSPEDYESQNDITIDDLFEQSLELDEPARSIDEKIEEANIVLDKVEYIHGDLPEEYQKNFDNLYINNETEIESPVEHLEMADEFRYLDDEGEIIGERETVFENRKSGLQIATIIFTVLLLLSIIVLCFCIFSASTSEGMAPSEYIRSVWQTLIG